MISTHLREATATLPEANTGVTNASANIARVQRETENAPKSVPAAGKEGDDIASWVNALKYTITNSKSPSAKMLAMYKFRGREPGDMSTSFPVRVP